MEQAELDRISELTRLSRERALTVEEAAEREVLRRAYVDSWRRGTERALERAYVRDEDGTVRKLKKQGG